MNLPKPCRLPLSAALLLLFSAGCAPTYQADRLEEHVREICRKEYKFDAEARRVGKTLYASVEDQDILTEDLGLQRKTFEKLFDALLTVTRVALSSDASIDYLVVKAKDVNTGARLTLIRYVPDIRWYFYMRISRADFENRGVMEIEPAGDKEAEEVWTDISMPEFMARLVASGLQQKITYNPLLSALSRVHRVRGEIQGDTLLLTLGRGEGEGGEDLDGLLRHAVVEKAGDALAKYDPAGAVRRVKVIEDKGPVVFDFSREELFAEKDKLPVKKPWDD